jgi:Uma2 family endonuclease
MLETTELVDQEQEKKIPSLNHSYICAQIMRQLLRDEKFQPLPELTLAVENGLTPDISVFPKEQIQPNCFEDVLKVERLPLLAIEVISSSQSIQSILDKAKLLVKPGVKTVWIIEPYGRSIFVLDHTSQQLFHEEVVASEGIHVGFAKVFHE